MEVNNDHNDVEQVKLYNNNSKKIVKKGFNLLTAHYHLNPLIFFSNIIKN